MGKYVVQALGFGSIFILVACSFRGNENGDGDGDGDGDGVIPLLDVSGSVVDFATGTTLAGSATVTTAGLTPAPSVTVTGAQFEIASVAPFSVFNILSASLPDYRSTYSVAIEVEDVDVSGVEAPALSEATITAYETEFGVATGSSMLIGRAVDENGDPVAGLAATIFELNNAAPVSGPFFLDDQLAPDAGLNATSASGYVVFFEVEPGLAAVTAMDGSGFTLEMAVAPISQAAATVASITVIVGDGEPLPTDVSFRDDVVPIFENRGCDVCHSGGGIGRDLGGVTLDASPNLIYRELTEELSPNGNRIRVDTVEPAASMLLTLPSPEDPPDGHPNSTFASPSDPDYRMILGWITEGAPDN